MPTTTPLPKNTRVFVTIIRGGREFNSNVLDISYVFPYISYCEVENIGPGNFKITINGNSLYHGYRNNTNVYVDANINNIVSSDLVPIDTRYYTNIKNWTNDVIEISVPETYFINNETFVKISYRNFFTNYKKAEITSSSGPDQ